jgi:hypothetical protein
MRERERERERERKRERKRIPYRAVLSYFSPSLTHDTITDSRMTVCDLEHQISHLGPWIIQISPFYSSLAGSMCSTFTKINVEEIKHRLKIIM